MAIYIIVSRKRIHGGTISILCVQESGHNLDTKGKPVLISQYEIKLFNSLSSSSSSSSFILKLSISSRIS